MNAIKHQLQFLLKDYIIKDDHLQLSSPFRVILPNNSVVWVRICSCKSEKCSCGTRVNSQILTYGKGLDFIPDIVFNGEIKIDNRLVFLSCTKQFNKIDSYLLNIEDAEILGKALAWLHSIEPDKIFPLEKVLERTNKHIIHADIFTDNLAHGENGLMLTDFADSHLGEPIIDFIGLMALNYNFEDGHLAVLKSYKDHICFDFEWPLASDLMTQAEIEIKNRINRRLKHNIPIDSQYISNLKIIYEQKITAYKKWL